MSNHEVKIIRVGKISPHPNADRLEITNVNGWQVVVKKGDFVKGQPASDALADYVSERLESMRTLTDGWGGYNETPPSSEIINAATELYKDLSKYYTNDSFVHITPTSGGHITLDFKDVEVLCTENGFKDATYEFDFGDGEYLETDDIALVRKWISIQ
jgi:hypothetical protein